jgi:hypothetical protein
VDSEQLDGRYKIIEDRDLTFLNPKRKTTIGESSEPYGMATVRVWEKDGVAWSPKPHFVLCEYKAGKLAVTPYGELKGGKLQPLDGVIDSQGKPFKLPPFSLG